jgi:DNA invertase Pin-like site-specific DNA recombinase
MTRRIGYARVSTEDQDLSIQKSTLDKADCAIVFEEKRSGTKRTGREQLELALKVLTSGDTLVVTRLDRLGRSLRDLANIAHEIETSGANLRVLEQSVDTGTSAGRAFFGMLAVFAQFETDVRRERQADGIARAKKAGVYVGGKPRIDRHEVERLTIDGRGPAAVARALGVSRMSVYRILRERKKSGKSDGGPGFRTPAAARRRSRRT